MPFTAVHVLVLYKSYRIQIRMFLFNDCHTSSCFICLLIQRIRPNGTSDVLCALFVLNVDMSLRGPCSARSFKNSREHGTLRFQVDRRGQGRNSTDPNPVER